MHPIFSINRQIIIFWSKYYLNLQFRKPILIFAEVEMIGIMDESLQTFSIPQLRERSSIFKEFGIGDDILFCEVRGSEIEKSSAIMSLLSYPIRFDGYMCCFCRKGHFRLDINLQSFEVGPNMFFLNIPGNITSFSLEDPSSLGNLELIFVFVSRDFISNLRFDFNKSFQDSIKLLNTPCITLNPHQVEIATDYFNLARKIINSPLSNRADVIGSLLSSLTYMTADIWKSNVSVAGERPDGKTARLNMIFDRFITLVTEYHTSERNMAFYANRLNLTPKYLSKLIRKVSGRSAPEWIDSFVILEAKNMLKYSDCSIKEIVYRLHFPNQSVFYKFFKSHTGMTPSEYRAH